MEAVTRKDVYAWLLGPHVSNGLYEDAIEARLDGTFDWFLTQTLFLDWISPDFPAKMAKTMWIHGAPGCGKTILCSRIVEHLRSTLDPPPAHFFYSFDDQESRRDPFVAVRSWLTQVLPHPAAFELVKEEWESQDGQAASRADVLTVFRKIVRAIPKLTFVLDGLDECDGANQPWEADHMSVANFLKTIKQAVAGTTTRVMIVSRNMSEIRQAMLRDEGATCIEYKLSCDDVQPDIELYARSVVNEKLHNKDDTVKNNISLRLASRCNGQFLWIKLQGHTLRSSKNKKQLEASIDRSPTALTHLYERDWQKLLGLPPEESTRAIHLLRWAAFALRPLTVAEITEALLINDDCVDFPVDEMPDSIDQDYVDGEIRRLCGSLVEIRSAPLDPIVGSQTVHLAHFSVKEFFVSRVTAGENVVVANERLRNSNEATQNSVLALMCLRYVNFRTVWLGQDEESDKVQVKERWPHRFATPRNCV
ncbi:hypothetical protein LMH87_001516 [Akanthomyces muscarius]|uniref:NACHT domain-containing protein n=1 Tax=Akanthomyces muscarius TaxID=2231603 RepID=A0A9W8UIQ6_AKAMU|nr:hypothetical protein LMH87_001516 [Akanthomyces muscarius]KAJ4146963.1 hypothetical protein LMH87_001516 [Akanthomyces muscarius]